MVVDRLGHALYGWAGADHVLLYHLAAHAAGSHGTAFAHFQVRLLPRLGKLMFAFVVLWAYLSFSQWLIIWSGNMLSEIKWYLMRLRGGWQYFGTALIFVHFVFPFALLLSRSLKRHGRRLILIALLILFMRMVDLFWLTAPNFYK